MLVALLIGASIFATALLVHRLEGVPVGDLTRDPTSVAGVPLYVGFVSQLGVFAWAAAASCCVLCALVLQRQGREARLRNFFLGWAGISLMLGLDDVFLLHEVFFPYFGIPELVVFGSYAVLLLAFLIRYAALVLKTPYLLLGLAFLFFGTSVLTDVGDIELSGPYVLEDGAKLFGIVAWLIYQGRSALGALVPLAARQDARSRGARRLPAGRTPLFSAQSAEATRLAEDPAVHH